MRKPWSFCRSFAAVFMSKLSMERKMSFVVFNSNSLKTSYKKLLRNLRRSYKIWIGVRLGYCFQVRYKNKSFQFFRDSHFRLFWLDRIPFSFYLESFSIIVDLLKRLTPKLTAGFVKNELKLVSTVKKNI